MFRGLKYTATFISHHKNTFLQTQQGIDRKQDMETGQKQCWCVQRHQLLIIKVITRTNVNEENSPIL